MNGYSHRLCTKKVMDIFKKMYNTTLIVANSSIISRECPNTDTYTDMEFVDVEFGRDDPHTHKLYHWNDEPHRSEGGRSFTAFNHFIDIKKGTGLFDDFDGYSYYKGSAHKDQYQDASELVDGFEWVFAEIAGFKVDEGINWWLNDEYVHAPCHKWYKHCSLAVERYSFYQDMGYYSNKKSELAARFPLASCFGGEGKGIPYSVFLPVDNLGRYWYNEFLTNSHMRHLGPVMHAVQDASVPHHTAGYMGNWHVEYENKLDDSIEAILHQSDFEENVKSLVGQWDRYDSNPPHKLNPEDKDLIPAINWRIDQLITWVALNAYHEYTYTYNHFQNGFKENANSIRKLVTLATAMSLLVLIKADKENPTYFIGNIDTKELHGNHCKWLKLMSKENIVNIKTYEEAKSNGYNGCYHCLRNFDNLVRIKNIPELYVGNNTTKELHRKNCTLATFLSTDVIAAFDTIKDAINEGYNGCWHCLKEYNIEPKLPWKRKLYILRRCILEILTEGNMHYSDLEKKVFTHHSVTTYTLKLEIKFLLLNGFIEKISGGIYKITSNGETYLILLKSSLST